MWNVSFTIDEMEFAWTMFPMPNAEIVVRMAKMIPSHFLFHPSLEDIHRTSCHPPSFGFDAVFHGENCFGIFRGDTENAGQPHPKHCTGPASGDGCRDTNDVPRADRGCQRSR